jgi:hypothetical protein
MPEEQKTEKSPEELKAFAVELLKEYPGGYSVMPDGSVVADRVAIDIISAEQFSELVREPRSIIVDLLGNKAIKFKVRPLDVNEWREIEDMDAEAPMPPPEKKAGQSLSLAKGAKSERNDVEKYDWSDPEYLKKSVRHKQLKQAAIISQGLLSIKIPGETVEQKRDYLAKNFTPRILGAIESAIRELTSNPIERALFTSGAG